MAKNNVKLNYSAFDEIRNCGNIQSFMLEKAYNMQTVAQSMGGTYESDVMAGETRAHALVMTADFHAMHANAKHNALGKALGSCGITSVGR